MVGQQGLVKVYVRGSLYIHVLQQDLRALFHTTETLPETAVSQDICYST